MSTATLGDVATLDRSSVGAAKIRDGTRYVGLEHIAADGSVHDALAVRAGEIKSNKFAFGPDHVLFGKLRPNLGKVADPGFEGVCSTDIIPVRPGPELDRRYLFHYLRTPSVRGEATRLAVGINLPRLKPQALAEFPIPLPPIEEQRRIAAVLDAADDLRAKRRQALAKLDTLTQAIFIDMFGDPLVNERRWPVRQLSEIVRPDTTVTYGIVQAGEECEGGVPYVRTGDLVNGEISAESLRHTSPEIASKFPRSRVEADEIVMSIRATVGTTALVPAELDGANLTQGTARISPGALTDPTYLVEHLRTQGTQAWIQRQVKGATFREITLRRLRELPVCLAPPDLQSTFVARIERLKHEREAMMQSAGRLDTLFASLQQRAFGGEL